MSAGLFGYWLGGFVLSMAVGYVFLRLAASRPLSATLLRVLGVSGAAFMGYLGYKGGGDINLGSVLAVVVTLAWAIKQHVSRKATAEAT
jgi:hypothetical protein